MQRKMDKDENLRHVPFDVPFGMGVGRGRGRGVARFEATGIVKFGCDDEKQRQSKKVSTKRKIDENSSRLAGLSLLDSSDEIDDVLQLDVDNDELRMFDFSKNVEKEGPAGSEAGRSFVTESIMADTLRNMLNTYNKKRAEMIESEGVVATPLHVVKKVAFEHCENIHVESMLFQGEQNFYRVELYAGPVRGVGEGVTKRIAAQMAAIDVLEHIQLSDDKSGVKLQAPAFLPGWLTSNQVFDDLATLCEANGLPEVTIKVRINADDKGEVDPKLPPYHAECWLGEELVYFGESEAAIFAKREAARKMFQSLTGHEYPDTPYAIGQHCRPANQLGAFGQKGLMSDYKKMWLLQHRVKGNELVYPDHELDFDFPITAQDLRSEVGEMAEKLSYKMLSKDKTIAVTIAPKKRRVTFEKKEDKGAGASDETVEDW